MSGIRCAVVAPAGDPARYSRRAATLEWADPWSDPEALVELLLAFARSQSAKPVLFYESDPSVLFVSRNREELADSFRFILPPAPLIEDLVDKLRFRLLAERLGLPVPASRVLDPRSTDPRDIGISYPLIVKPATRGDRGWTTVEPARKAVRVDSGRELSLVWSRLAAFDQEVLAQELVPGPETCIESYHGYVDEDGTVAADFTGRKVRTKPMDYGHTTALVITDAADVQQLGRDIVLRLGIRGVAKLDFKRTMNGSLRLLEVNPRFTLWHHPGALAGVNIPAMVWADMAGQPRPPTSPSPRAGVSWMSPWDLQAALEYGLSGRDWLRWARRCDARSMMDLGDPLPFLRLCVQRARRGLHRG